MTDFLVILLLLAVVIFIVGVIWIFVNLIMNHNNNKVPLLVIISGGFLFVVSFVSLGFVVDADNSQNTKDNTEKVSKAKNDILKIHILSDGSQASGKNSTNLIYNLKIKSNQKVNAVINGNKSKWINNGKTITQVFNKGVSSIKIPVQMDDNTSSVSVDIKFKDKKDHNKQKIVQIKNGAISYSQHKKAVKQSSIAASKSSSDAKKAAYKSSSKAKESSITAAFASSVAKQKTKTSTSNSTSESSNVGLNSNKSVKSAITEDGDNNLKVKEVNGVYSDSNSKDVAITLKGKENISNKMTVKGFWLDIRTVWINLKKSGDTKNFENVNVSVKYPLQDEAGNTTNEYVVKTNISGEKLSAINTENFLFKNVPNYADSYWQSPALPKIN